MELVTFRDSVRRSMVGKGDAPIESTGHTTKYRSPSHYALTLFSSFRRRLLLQRGWRGEGAFAP